MQLLGTPSEEEWPGFSRRAAKIGLRIESSDAPPKSPPATPKTNKTEPSSSPTQDDPLASFMAQIETKPESLDNSSTKDAESDTKDAESETSDKELVRSDVEGEGVSTSAANSTHVVDTLTSDGLLLTPTDVAGAAPLDGAVPIPNTNTSMETQSVGNTAIVSNAKRNEIVESEELSTASLHAARVACAASRFVHFKHFCCFSTNISGKQKQICNFCCDQ